MNTFSGASSAPKPPQPLDTNARTPVFLTALNIISVNSLGLSTTIDPKPMYNGGGPASKNLTRSSGGL